MTAKKRLIACKDGALVAEAFVTCPFVLPGHFDLMLISPVVAWFLDSPPQVTISPKRP